MVVEYSHNAHFKNSHVSCFSGMDGDAALSDTSHSLLLVQDK